MHAVKSAARKQAWYHNNDPDSRTYNIFGRGTRNPRRVPDEESGSQPPLSHVMSENNATSPVEAKRRGEWGRADSSNQYGGVRHADTYPASPTDYQQSRGLSRDLKDRDDTEKSTPFEDIETADETSKDSKETNVSDIPPTEPEGSIEQSAGPTGTRRRRRKFLGMTFSGKKDDGDDLSRSTTTQSSKSKKSTKKYGHLKFTAWGQTKAIMGSWINVLLIFVPIGIAAEYAHLPPGVTFSMNFVAIIPLASMLSYATEELACYVGETFGGLLNASFGNATELIVSIIALSQGEVLIVQTSLIGSMLSNLLLVLGMCFFFGGLNRLEQHFNITVAQTAASLLALAIGALVTPTAFRIFSPDDTGVTPTSRAASILLLLTYICYLFFQLRTHIDMYNKPSPKAEKQNLIVKNKKPQQEVNVSRGLATMGARASAAAGGPVNSQYLVQNGEDEEDEPQISSLWALGTLVISTALIAVTSDGLVSAIDPVTQPQGPLSKEFVGLILIPIVGNAAEHATAVTVAIKDKMDLAIGVAVGSSLQIVLLVLPIMVILGWIGVGAPYGVVMDLNFDGFQVVVLFIAIILVNYVIQDGSSHWLEGVMLLITYIIFAVAAWYYPADPVPL